MNTADLYKLFCEHPVITTDTRECPKGAIFFALKGETFDGNKFATMPSKKAAPLLWLTMKKWWEMMIA